MSTTRPTTRIGSGTIRLMAALAQQHTADAEAGRSLSVLRGGMHGSLVQALARLQQNNRRRLDRRADARPAASSGDAPATEDREALESYLEVVRRLADREGRKSATRLLRRDEESASDPALRRLGARMARHCSQGCSVTGVRIAGMAVRSGSNRGATCEPTAASNAVPPLAGARAAGEFTIAAAELGTSPTLLITLHNVLGRTRPVVPVLIEPIAIVRAGDSVRELRMKPAPIFVFAEDIAPGSHRTLSCHAPRLMETLPCPRGLLSAVTFRVWLPVALAATPDPLPSSSSRLLAA